MTPRKIVVVWENHEETHLRGLWFESIQGKVIWRLSVDPKYLVLRQPKSTVWIGINCDRAYQPVQYHLIYLEERATDLGEGHSLPVLIAHILQTEEPGRFAQRTLNELKKQADKLARGAPFALQ